MNVSVVNESLASLGADAVVVGVYAEEKKLRDPAGRVDQAAGGAVRNVLEAEKFQGKIGQVTHIHTNGTLPSRRVVVVGLGRRRDTTAESIRRAASAGVRRARDLGAKNVAIEVLGDRLPARQRAQSVVEGAILGTYTFDRYKREKTDKHVDTLRLAEPDGRYRREATEGARRGQIFAEATWFARDLINAPANDVHPTHLAEVAADIAEAGGVKLQVLERDDCKELGMGAFLGVAAGSEQPPKFIHLSWTPSGRNRKKVAIIGKGDHLRLRRPRPQERRGHAAHEGRHVGRGRRARDHARAARAQAGGRSPRPDRRHREHALRLGHPSRRRAPGDERDHDRDRQHRRRGPADAGRRHLLRRSRRSTPTRSSTWRR